jgi:hypothetical protein
MTEIILLSKYSTQLTSLVSIILISFFWRVHMMNKINNCHFNCMGHILSDELPYNLPYEAIVVEGYVAFYTG